MSCRDAVSNVGACGSLASSHRDADLQGRVGRAVDRGGEAEEAGADCRRLNIYFNITSPAPGTFIITLHFKGRDKPIIEMDLKIDDLLEQVSNVWSGRALISLTTQQKENNAVLDLEYVQLNVPKVLALFNKVGLGMYLKRRS